MISAEKRAEQAAWKRLVCIVQERDDRLYAAGVRVNTGCHIPSRHVHVDGYDRCSEPGCIKDAAWDCWRGPSGGPYWQVVLCRDHARIELKGQPFPR